MIIHQRERMSFLNITDARKRNEIVAEYLAVKKKIKNNDYNERIGNFSEQRTIEKSLDPVVQSTNASTEAITKQLLPIEKGIIEINKKMERNDKKIKEEPEEKPIVKQESEESSDSEHDDDDENEWERVMDRFSNDKKDKYFGIVRHKNKYRMGNKTILMKGGDIIVDDTAYKSTPGLWSLIMYKKPNKNTYTEEDMRVYEKLVHQTNVMSAPNNVGSNSKIQLTYKWRKLFPNFRKEGEGIEFLPSDIKSLQDKLSYLLATFQAGNKSATRNKIIAIADNLLHRNYLSREKYRQIMHQL